MDGGCGQWAPGVAWTMNVDLERAWSGEARVLSQVLDAHDRFDGSCTETCCFSQGVDDVLIVAGGGADRCGELGVQFGQACG